MFNHFHNIEQSDGFVDIPQEIRNALPKLPLDLRQVKALKYSEAAVEDNQGNTTKEDRWTGKLGINEETTFTTTEVKDLFPV